VALAFNEAITRRDADALAVMMTEDHSFVDSANKVIAGRDPVLRAWRGFFEAYPDYRNAWSDIRSRHGLLIATGHSVCPNEPLLDGPAIGQWESTPTECRTASDHMSGLRTPRTPRSMHLELLATWGGRLRRTPEAGDISIITQVSLARLALIDRDGAVLRSISSRLLISASGGN
jgi:hypothetical protein